jgi:hypothetical protein
LERVGFGLQAPAAVPVELRGSRRRVFRLSHALGEEGISLVRPAPFDPGEPVEIRVRVPEGDEPVILTLHATVELMEGDDADGATASSGGRPGGRGLRLTDPPHDARLVLARYVARRLGLPSPAP